MSVIYHPQEYKSSKEQMNEEFHQMYRELTDPEEISKQKVLKNREKQAKENKEDFGL